MFHAWVLLITQQTPFISTLFNGEAMKNVLFFLLLVTAQQSLANDYILGAGSKVTFNIQNDNVLSQDSLSSLSCGPSIGEGNTLRFVACGAGTDMNSTGDCFVESETPFNIDFYIDSAQTCLTSLGTPEWRALSPTGSGFFSANINSINETTSFQMACNGPLGQTTKTLTVSYGNPNEFNCSSFSPPPGTSNDNPGVTFEDLTVAGASIGSAQSLSINFEIRRNKYWAIKTTFPNDIMSRKETFTEPFSNTTRAGYRVAISKCPGDFSGSAQSSNGRCAISGGTLSLRWTTDLTQSPTFRCLIEPGETYYLNIIHSIIEPYSQTDCSDTECGVLFQESLD